MGLKTVVFFFLQLVLGNAGTPCTVEQSGASVLVYCESNCCDGACCTQAEDSQTPYIALGVVLAIVIVAMIVVLIVCWLRHKNWFRKEKSKEKIKPKDNVVSVYDEPEEAVC